MPSMPPPPPASDRMTFSVSGADYDVLLEQAQIILDIAAQDHRYSFDLEAEPGVMTNGSGHPSLWLW